MLEPNNILSTQPPEAPRRDRRQSINEYTDLVRELTPEPPEAQRRRLSLPTQQRDAADAQPRRPSIPKQQRDAADALTHPSRNFHLRRLATRDAAHAEELLAVFCARLCDWGLATFEQASPEARLLHELTTLNILLQSSAQARAADPSAFETEAHASGVLSLTREIMHARDKVQGFRLSFEVDRHIYDIVEVVQCLHSAAVATLLGLFLST